MDETFLKGIASLGTEGRNPATMELDRVPTVEMVRLINEENRRCAEAVGQASGAIAEAIELIADRLRCGGRLVYIGAGTSGRLGVVDASECPPTFSVDPGLVVGLIAGGDHAIRFPVENAEDDPNGAEKQLREIGFNSHDVLCGIAASGRTPYVLGGLRYARSLGAATVSVSNNAASTIGQEADIAIEAVTGPEALTGSTRLKAGTAQKMVLNILTTGVMIRLGKTYSNLMVDVKASNRKLQSRCINILRAICPDRETAELEQALAEAGGRVKLAAAMLRTGLSAGDAKQRLTAAGGHLGEVIGY